MARIALGLIALALTGCLLGGATWRNAAGLEPSVNAGVLLTHLRRLGIDPPPAGCR